MRFSCLPGDEVQFQQQLQHTDKLVTMSFHASGVTRVQVYTPSTQELLMKQAAWWFEGLWQSIPADTLVHLVAQNKQKMAKKLWF